MKYQLFRQNTLINLFPLQTKIDKIQYVNNIEA